MGYWSSFATCGAPTERSSMQQLRVVLIHDMGTFAEDSPVRARFPSGQRGAPGSMSVVILVASAIGSPFSASMPFCSMAAGPASATR